MKKYALLVIAGFILAFASCKKDGSNSKIVGKWYVNKLSIKQQDLTKGTTADTTFTGNTFNSLDFFQFNSDGTASSSTSGIFTVYGKGLISSNINIAGKNSYTYILSGQVLTLTSTFIHPTAGTNIESSETDTILQADSHNLAIRDVMTNTAYKTTTDTYYTKAN